MKPSSPDFKFVQVLFKTGKFIGALQMRCKFSFVFQFLILVVVTSMLYLAYYAISIYWKLELFATNRFIFIFWYVLQLIFMFAIYSKHFGSHKKWQKFSTLFSKIEHISKEMGFSMRSITFKIIIEVIFNQFVTILELTEWLMGNVDLYNFISASQWRMTTFYMSFLLLLTRNVAAFVHRRYNFIKEFLEKRNNIVDENVLMFQLKQAQNIIVDLSNFLKLFNQIFGLQIFFQVNVIIVATVSSVIFVFRRIEESESNEFSIDQLILFICFTSYQGVSLDC